MLKASEQKDFALRLERWRAGVKTIEERNTSRIMWERQEVRKRELVSEANWFATRQDTCSPNVSPLEIDFLLTSLNPWTDPP